jgi:hypothetical protein
MRWMTGVGDVQDLSKDGTNSFVPVFEGKRSGL